MKLNGIIVALCSVGILNAHAENVAIAKSSLNKVEVLYRETN